MIKYDCSDVKELDGCTHVIFQSKFTISALDFFLIRCFINVKRLVVAAGITRVLILVLVGSLGSSIAVCCFNGETVLLAVSQCVGGR
jgi:hypothetical protein